MYSSACEASCHQVVFANQATDLPLTLNMLQEVLLPMQGLEGVYYEEGFKPLPHELGVLGLKVTSGDLEATAEARTAVLDVSSGGAVCCKDSKKAVHQSAEVLMQPVPLPTMCFEQPSLCFAMQAAGIAAAGYCCLLNLVLQSSAASFPHNTQTVLFCTHVNSH